MLNRQHKKLLRTVYQRITLVTAGLLLVLTGPLTAIVHADTFDEQIRSLQAEVSGFQAEAGRLRAQANSLQAEVNALQAEKNALQTQISLSEAKLAQINADIVRTEKQIENNKVLLAGNLKASYLDSSITPIEILASSSSISDFIDKQEYRNKIQDAVKTALKRIKELKESLTKQKKEAELTLADQTAQRDALAAKELEQANLLARTQGEEAAYQQLTKERNGRIAELRAQQAAANLKWGGNVTYQPRGGGYPSIWADPPMDTMVDDWLMYNRECTSFSAFKVAVSGRHGPTGYGNANQWPGNARSRGIPVDTSPRAGDVAVWPIGYYGHVMYVEAVTPAGDIYISEYNYDWTGRYSERTITRGTWQAQGFVFIHFP